MTSVFYITVVMGIIWFPLAVYANANMLRGYGRIGKIIVLFLYFTVFVFFWAAYYLSPFILIFKGD